MSAIGAVVLLLVVSLLGLAAPVLLVQCTIGTRANQAAAIMSTTFILAVGNSLSGGVMLAVGLMHMMPDGIERLISAGCKSAPFYAGMWTTVGVCLPLFLERIGSIGAACRAAKPPQEVQSTVDKEQPLLSGKTQTAEQAPLTIRAHWQARKQFALRTLYNMSSLCDEETNAGHLDEGPSEPHLERSKSDGARSMRRKAVLVGLIAGDTPVDFYCSETGLRLCHCPTHPVEVSPQGSSTDLLMVLVFSLHAVFAGLALGISSGSTEQLILFALLLHKGFEAIAVGVSISKSGRSIYAQCAEAIIFALATPTGAVLGGHLSLPDGTTGCMIALSAGTFLYIALAEVLPEEFGSHHGHRPIDGSIEKLDVDVVAEAKASAIKLAAWTVGVVIMGLLGLVV